MYNFIGCDSEYGLSNIVIFGAPIDSTTSFRPGTRFASRAMRTESFGIETYSPYQDMDLADICVHDGGDLELPFGSPAKSLDMIEEYAEKIICDNKIPVMIGGEHLVTLGAVRALVKRYPDLHIIHFDAHADFRDEYLGEKLSHACVMRRCHEIVGDRIFQYGIRSGERAEFEFAKLHTIKEIPFDKPIYFTIDLDVLDPADFPGTGTPEAGGLRFNELLEEMRKVKNIVGADIVELSPIYDPTGRSTALACKALRELLLIIGG